MIRMTLLRAHHICLSFFKKKKDASDDNAINQPAVKCDCDIVLCDRERKHICEKKPAEKLCARVRLRMFTLALFQLTIFDCPKSLCNWQKHCS